MATADSLAPGDRITIEVIVVKAAAASKMCALVDVPVSYKSLTETHRVSVPWSAIREKLQPEWQDGDIAVDAEGRLYSYTGSVEPRPWFSHTSCSSTRQFAEPSYYRTDELSELKLVARNGKLHGDVAHHAPDRA